MTLSAADKQDRETRKQLRWLRRRGEIEAIRLVLANERSTHALNTSVLAERLYQNGMRVRARRTKAGAA